MGKDKSFIKRQIISGILIGLLINALILVISLAAPPTSPYQPGETLNPNCSPGDPNCTVLPPITSLNGLTTTTQTFSVGTSGNDFNIVSTGSVHTFNLPDASTSSRGLVSTGTQTFAGDKTFTGNVGVSGNNNLFFVNKGKRESPQGGPYDWYRGFVYLGKDLNPDEWQTSTMDPVYNSAYLVLGVDTDIGAFMPAIYNPNDLSYLRAANIEGASGVFQGDIYLQKTEGSSIFFKPSGGSIESEIRYDSLNKKIFLIGYNRDFSFQIKTETPIINEIFSIYNSSTPLLSLGPSGDLTVNGFIIATSGIACNDPDAGCGWYFRNKDITDWYLKYDSYGGPSLNLSLGNSNNTDYSFKIGFDDGTNFVPGIIFSNSGNIKFNNPWSNIYGENLKIWGSSNSNLLLQPPDSSSGNIGIGTTTPTEKLDVVGNIKASGSLISSSLTPGSILFAGTGGVISQDNANLFWDNTNKRLGIGTTTPAGILHVATGTTNALVVNNVGNVGIGTTNPAYKLDVAGNIRGQNNLYVSGYVGIGTTSPSAALEIYRTNTSSILTITSATSTTYSPQIQFRTGNPPTVNYSIGVERNFNNLVITSGNDVNNFDNGITITPYNVGIGTNSPSTKLHVFSNTSAILFLEGYSGSSFRYSISSLSNTGKWSLFVDPSDFGNTGAFMIASANDAFNSFNPRLAISHSSGNVGIGTTTPAYKLHVIGSIAQTNAVNCALSSDSNGQIICTPSSLKYKENIQDLMFDKEKFLSLQPRTFEFKKDLPFKIEGKQVGFIAEEVQSVFPELVRYNQNNEPEGLKYEQIPVYLYAIVKDLIINFSNYVKDALSQLGVIVEQGVVKIEKMFVKEVVINFAEIDEAKINKATVNQLCFEDENGTVCINKQDLKNILERTGGGGQFYTQNGANSPSGTNITSSGTSTPTTTPTSTPSTIPSNDSSNASSTPPSLDNANQTQGNNTGQIQDSQNNQQNSPPGAPQNSDNNQQQPSNNQPSNNESQQ
ncbi:hypothetical protein HRbin35_00123 [bacterium HR35]|nr:hypothetical protein HRbin35_00123 [bacterium HR35]